MKKLFPPKCAERTEIHRISSYDLWVDQVKQHKVNYNEFEDVDLYGILRSEHRLGEG